MKVATGMFAALALAMIASTASATTVEDWTIGDGTTSWTSATSAVGSSSLELYWPKPGSNYAGVRIHDLGAPTVSEFNNWSYWANAPESYVPTFAFSLDTPLADYAGQDYDTNIIIWPRNTGQSDTWLQFDSSQSLPYTIWRNGFSGPVMKSMTWEQFQQPFSQWGSSFDFSGDIIRQIRISNNGIGTNQTITAYLDDVMVNGETISLEGAPEAIPEPLTMLGLGMGAVGIGGYLRRRRSR